MCEMVSEINMFVRISQMGIVHHSNVALFLYSIVAIFGPTVKHVMFLIIYIVRIWSLFRILPCCAVCISQYLTSYKLPEISLV